MTKAVNRYTLTDEIKQEYLPIIQDFINKVEAATDQDELVEIDLTNTKLNPHTLTELLKQLGYDDNGEGMDTNGWQMDFWVRMHKVDFKPITIEGTGVTFELGIREEG